MSPQAFPQDKKWLALALLALAQFVVVLDASIVNVALPSIGTDLNFAQDDLSWVVNGYTLFFGGFLLLGGRMADLLGRRRLFIAGLILFALASLAGGLATSPGLLIAARAVQGLGAALLSPAALSLVTVMFAEGAERNKALGVWGAVAGSGGAAGVLLGGILTEYAGWEWVLFVNVPIGLAAAFFATRLLPESRNAGARHFDVAGAVSVTAGLSLLVYTLVDANDAGWLSGQTLGLGAVALALLAAFFAIERVSKAPLVPFAIFRRRTITGDQHRRPARGDGAVLDVLLHLALHAAGARLQRDQVRAVLPAAGGRDHRVGRHRLEPRHEARLQARARHRARADRDRPRLVRAGRRRRHLPRRHPVPVADRRGRPGLRVRADDDRRGQRRRAARGGPRVRAHQHVAADRRRAGPGHPGRDRELAHRRA